MQNIFIDVLPPWVETGLQPAFYDLESGTVLQQTARMYNKVNEVVQLVDHQNEVIDDYIDKFNQLHDYVDDYFDNLDVQAEINNKLDEMSEDGSLTALIKAYVDPIEEAFENEMDEKLDDYKQDVNNHIATMNTKIDNITSGTPIPVSSTSGMVDTTRIYLNTTDGYWYYYDGDSWEQGGVYQAVGINTSSVTFNSLEGKLKNSLEPRFSDNVYDDYQSGWVGSNGTIHTSTNLNQFYIELDLSGNEILYFSTYYNTTYMTTSQCAYVVLDENDEVLDSYPVTEATTDFITGVVTCSPLARKIYFNSCALRVNPASPCYYILDVTSFAQKDVITYSQLGDDLKTIFQPYYEEVEGEVFIESAYFNTNQAPNNYASTNIMKYEVEGGQLIKIEKSKNIYNNPVIFLCSKDVTFTYTYNDEDYDIRFRRDWLPNPIVSGSGLNEDIYFTVPYWCDTIYVNTWKANTDYKFLRAEKFKVNANTTTIDLSDVVKNPLDNKTLCFTGDSIIAASTAGVRGVVSLLGDINTNTNFYNYAHDGYTIAKATDAWSSRSIQNTLPTILSEHPDTDYIVFDGGINDMYGGSHGITLGNISNSYNPNNFDRTTFTGGLEYIFNYIYDNFQNCKPVFIVSHQIYSANFKPYMDRAKEVCNKWSVPYIDLWDESTLNFQISYMRSRFAIHTEANPNGDGIHPNLEGYQRITPYIDNCLKYKM